MLRKVVILAATAAMLTGCAGTGPSTVISQVSSAVTQVKSATTSVCRFVPTDETIVSLLNSLSSSFTQIPVATLAAQICDTVSRLGAQRGVTPTLYGVPIRGRRVP